MDIKTLKHNPSVNHTGEETPMQKTVKLGIYILFALGFITVYFLLKLHVFAVFGTWLKMASKFSLGAFFAIADIARRKTY
jgi:hypothetical protein